MLRPGATAPAGIADLAGGGWRFVNRQPGSGTRLLMDHLLQQAALAPQDIPGYFTRIEQTHVAVAAAVAAGGADVGLGIEAAAREAGLDFVPWPMRTTTSSASRRRWRPRPCRGCAPRWRRRAGRRRCRACPATACTRPGEVLSLTRALPWWNFARARRSRHAADAHA